MSDELLRAAYQQQVKSIAPSNRDGCPSPEDMHALVVATSIAETGPHIAQLEHVLTCASCHPEYALLRAARNAGAKETGSLRSRVTLQRVALAATLLVAVGVGSEAWRRNQESVTRAPTIDGADVMLVSPAAGDAPMTGRFVWRTVAGAVAYQFELLDSAGVSVVQGTTADTTLQLSAADSARVAALPVFDWMVAARRSDGNERRSPLTRVRLP